MKDWNPDLYKRFEKQRTQPVKDLIDSIEIKHVNRIIDIGCGPGNSTEQLALRWKDASIIGIDSSANMIKEANERLPHIQFEERDANQDLSGLGHFDLVFSNAAIQWMPNHHELLQKFFGLVQVGGALAVQIPSVSNMGIQRAVKETAISEKWNGRFITNSYLNYENTEYYYNICSELSEEIYIWETDYYHVMENHQRIIEWYKSTGMKPYLDALNTQGERMEFEETVLDKIRIYYKEQRNGRVLFPFRRIFFIVYKE